MSRDVDGAHGRGSAATPKRRHRVMQKRGGDRPRIAPYRAGAAHHHAPAAGDHGRAVRRPVAARQDRAPDRRPDGGRGVLHLPQAPGRLARAVRHRRPQPRRRAQHAAEARRGPRRALRRAGRAHQRAGRAEPSGLLLPARDGRGDLPLVPGRAGAARRRRAGRADGPEQDAEGIFRRGRRGAADHRHGAGRASGVGRGRRRQHRRRVQPRRRPRGARPAAVGGPGAGPRRAARAARRRHRARGQGPRGRDRPAGSRGRGAEGLHRRDAGAGRAGRRPASIARCSRPTACSRTTAAGCGA